MIKRKTNYSHLNALFVMALVSVLALGGIGIYTTVTAFGATNYPTSLDSYTTKTSSDDVQASHINDPQDAIEALEAKVGIDSSAVTTSHDYKLTHGLLKYSGAQVYNTTLPATDDSYSTIDLTDSSPGAGLTGGRYLVTIKIKMTSASADLVFRPKGVTESVGNPNSSFRGGGGMSTASVAGTRVGYIQVLTNTTAEIEFAVSWDGNSQDCDMWLETYHRIL